MLAVLWLGCSLMGGALLALLAKRLHPALPFRNMWIFYSALLGLFVGIVFAAALT